MRVYPKVKRIIDISFSSAGLLMLSPVFLLVGIMITIEAGGPVFFRQRRIGRKGRIFTIYKFRSMTDPAYPEEGSFDPGDSRRVTTVGKFLRRTKLDELPQLFNVLIGDMSLVGPRPEVEEWVKFYPEKWHKVLSVKPGMTDKASIEFRDEEKILSKSADPEATYRDVILPRKLDLCMDYVNNQSFTGDLRLILITIKTIIKP